MRWDRHQAWRSQVVEQGRLIQLPGSRYRSVAAGDPIPATVRSKTPAKRPAPSTSRDFMDEGEDPSDDEVVRDHPPYAGTYLPCPENVPGDLQPGATAGMPSSHAAARPCRSTSSSPSGAQVTVSRSSLPRLTRIGSKARSKPFPVRSSTTSAHFSMMVSLRSVVQYGEGWVWSGVQYGEGCGWGADAGEKGVTKGLGRGWEECR